MIYDWPSNLRVRDVSFNPRGMTVSGPRSLTGRSQIGSIDAGFWTASITTPPMAGDQIKSYRAFRMLLEGGAHQARVPVMDHSLAPWPLDPEGCPIMTSAPGYFDDGASFDDGSGFWQPVIAAYVSGDTDARSTRLTIDFLNAGEIMAGVYFSVVDRLHIIRQVLSTNGTEKDVAIWPPLREAVADGAQLNFDEPVCLMRLSDEASGDLSINPAKHGAVELSFEEVF